MSLEDFGNCRTCTRTMASGSRSINKGSDGLFQNECDVCLTRGITSEGISYCTVCYENLCQRCEQSHRGSRGTRDHTLVTGSSIPSASTQTTPHVAFTFCDTHKQLLLNVFCKVHNEMLCITCKAMHHKKCDTVDVSRQVKTVNVAGEFNVVLKSVSGITDRFNHLQQMRQADKTSLNGKIQICLKDLQKIRKDMNDKLDDLENKMAAQIRHFENKISKEIDDHHAILKSVLVQIDDLKKSLNECQKAHDDDVMFIGMKKASSRTTEFEKIIDSIQEDIYPIDIRVEPNDILTDLMNQLQTIGTLVTGKQTGYSRSAPTYVTSKAAIDKQVRDNRFSPKSLLNIEVIGKGEKIDLKSNLAYGCVFMADGHLVVACGTDGLELFDKDCRYKSQLDITSWDVAVIDDTSVIVTQGPHKQLQCVRVLPDMKVVKTVKMDRPCLGVDVCGDELYVTCYDDHLAGKDEVRVLTMDSSLLRRLGVDNGEYMFTKPRFVKVSKDGDKVFVSDWRTHTITCLSSQGRTLYKYTDTDLKYPRGMYVDEADNLFVCGRDSHNVHVIRHDGNREKILLSGKDGIVYPMAISYRPQDGCLAVVMVSCPSQLLTFSTRI